MAWASRSGGAQRALVFVLVVSVASWAPVSPLHAQAPGVAPPSGDEPEQLAEPAPLEELEEPAAQPVSAGGGERNAIEKQLQAITREHEESTNLWPWLTVGLGATGAVVGTVTGLANAFACEPDEAGCEAPPWAALTVVVGVLIGTLGAIWLVRTDRGIAELELRKSQLKYDLDRLEATRERRNGLARGSASQLRLKFEF